MDIGPSEADEFLRKLARRGLRGVKLVISDAHECIKAAIGKVLHASWQRCRVHFMRNVLALAGRQGRSVVAAFIGTAFVQDDAEAASKQWRQVAAAKPLAPLPSDLSCRTLKQQKRPRSSTESDIVPMLTTSSRYGRKTTQRQR